MSSSIWRRDRRSISRIYYSSDDSNVQNVSVAIGITEFGCVC